MDAREFLMAKAALSKDPESIFSNLEFVFELLWRENN